MKIIAHRGEAGLGCENTLSCIEAGLATGRTDMVEVDVHLTKDGHVVVCHDPEVSRTTDGKGMIKDLTLAQIRSFHIKDKEGRIMHETMPTLLEVLQSIGDRAELLLEIKRSDDRDDGLERKCLDVIRKSGAYGRVTVQSFNDIVLDRFHQMDPAVRLEKLLFFRPFNWEKVQRQNHIASYNIFFRGLVTRRFVHKMHLLGREVKVWTLKRPSQIPADNIDGIITDRPDLF